MAANSPYPDSIREIKPEQFAHGLTMQQAKLLGYIRECFDICGMAPSFEEMKEAMGLASKSGIHRLITALEQRGHIERIPASARAMRLRTANDTVTTRRALEIILSRCKLNPEAELSLKYLLAGECQRGER